jgi:hypothetical protein
MNAKLVHSEKGWTPEDTTRNAFKADVEVLEVVGVDPRFAKTQTFSVDRYQLRFEFTFIGELCICSYICICMNVHTHTHTHIYTYI